MDLTDKNQLIEYLKEHNLWAKKGLSQNFLVDKNALEKIVESAELESDDFVVEIGPGAGSLTSELVKHVNEVVSIEMDEEFAKLLPEILNYKSEIPNKSEILNSKNLNIKNSLKIENCKLKIICDDIMKVNLDDIIGTKPYKVVANIPYHITSKILELFLSRQNKPEIIVLLVQKEVAERVCAKPGQMSTLAVSVQLYGNPEIVDIVPKESFFPSPKVDSAILKIAISNQLSVIGMEQERAFFRLVHIGFAAKRKTLVNNLTIGYQLEREKVIAIITSMGLKETVRAQELSTEEWKELTEVIGNGEGERCPYR